MSSINTLTQTDIDYVSSAVVEAGILAPRLRADIEILEKTGPNDLVTTADFALSKIIVSRLKERFAQDTIISEEDKSHVERLTERVWLIDPIDGTDNYIANDDQYSVMVGFVVNGNPIFGWVYAPAGSIMYFGGPEYGSFRKEQGKPAHKFGSPGNLLPDAHARIILGWRDRKKHPWIKDHPQVTLVKVGSVGLKVSKILEGEADLFAYLSGRLKIWDTAGPAAIAMGGRLEVGAMEFDGFHLPEAGVVHTSSVIIGRPGSIQWCRSHLGNSVGANEHS